MWLLLFAFLGLQTYLHSNYAALDTSFNGSGFTFNTTQTPPWQDQDQTCTALQSDGKILVAGSAQTEVNAYNQVAIVRFDANGALDTTFAGGAGYLLYTIPANSPTSTGYSQLTFGMTVLEDDSILLTGTSAVISSWLSLFVLKLNADGSINTSFGTGANITPNDTTNAGASQTVIGNIGSILYNYGSPLAIYSIATQADGKILVAGQANDQNPICFRFLSYGALDTTFNSSGTPGILNIASYGAGQGATGSLINSIALDASNKIYLAGQYNPNTSSSDHFPVIFQASSGLLNNTSYGTALTAPAASVSGAIINANITTGTFNNVVIQPDGKAVAIGTAIIASVSQNPCMILARFTTAGQLDTTFGNGLGYVVNQLSSNGIGICINENNQFVVTGQYGDSNYAAMYRFNANGSLDMTFAPNGYFALNNIGYTSAILGAALRSNGKVISGATINGDFGAFQLLGSNILQATIPSIIAYGFNKNDFQEFLYNNEYAQIITDPAAYSATITAMNNIFNTYAASYSLQPNFNYVLYLYLIKPEIVQAQALLTNTYQDSAAQITQFFDYITTRINSLSAVQQ